MPSFCLVVRRETTGVERTHISGRRTEGRTDGRAGQTERGVRLASASTRPLSTARSALAAVQPRGENVHAGEDQAAAAAAAGVAGPDAESSLSTGELGERTTRGRGRARALPPGPWR